MDYLLFTYPNCRRCEELKVSLQAKNVAAEEFSLTKKEGKVKIRAYLKDLRRDEKGAIIIPTLILEERGRVSGVVNSRQEFEEWWQSRA